jgi:hypothetical protein
MTTTMLAATAMMRAQASRPIGSTRSTNWVHGE